MDSFQIVGIIIIAGFIVYLVNFYYNKKNVENFTSTDITKLSTNLKDAANDMNSELNVYSNKTTYQDVISNLTSYINSSIVSLILTLDATVPQTPTILASNIAKIEKINTLQTAYNNMASISKQLSNFSS